jgi:hypothetical protein
MLQKRDINHDEESFVASATPCPFDLVVRMAVPYPLRINLSEA